jgi:hypothetical protein
MFRNGQGKVVPNNIREAIVYELIQCGSDINTGIVKRGLYTTISQKFNITKTSVINIWKRYVQTDSFEPTIKSKVVRKKRLLSEEDELYISQKLLISPCLLQKEIRSSLLQNSNNFNLDKDNTVLCQSTICRTIKSRLPQGEYSRKRVRSSNIRRWTPENITATDDYIAFVQTFDINKLRFMDECGFQPSTANKRFYGYGRKGESIVNISQHLTGSNVTLNLVLGFDNILFGTVQETTSDHFSYMNFWHECLEAYTPTGEKVLEAGCIIIVDNCPTHRFQRKTF